MVRSAPKAPVLGVSLLRAIPIKGKRYLENEGRKNALGTQNVKIILEGKVICRLQGESAQKNKKKYVRRQG